MTDTPAKETLEMAEAMEQWREYFLEEQEAQIFKALNLLATIESGGFNFGDRVRKKGEKGQWHGTIVGFYSSTCTDIGYAVESERETGSVQIYPAEALEKYDG